MEDISINGHSLTSLGVMLLEGSYASLLTPPQMKEWVSNDDPRVDGIEYIVPTTSVIKERSVNLYFLVRGATRAEFLSRYNTFIGMLQSGMVNIRIPDLSNTFKLKYESCTSFDHYNLTMCKVAVKFTEPQPANMATTMVAEQ
jgi:hypothetical protein